MRISLKKIYFLILSLYIPLLYSQEKTDNTPQKAVWKGGLKYRSIPSIKEQIKNKTFIHAKVDKNNRFGREKRTKGNQIVPGKGYPKGIDPLVENQNKAPKTRIKSLNLNFESTNLTSTPSDPTGAVGRDFYIASWNTAFRIFNKDGTPAMEAASLETLFPGGTDGDPIVLYDAAADRYILTEFEDEPNGFHVAISKTNDPINDGWHIYSADSFETIDFPDYTKFSIWSDGYYVTANISGGNGNIWALERDKMLNGDTTASIQAFSLPGISTNEVFYSPQAFNVTDDNLPAAGNATIVFMQDDAWTGISDDHLKLWTINVDWDNPTNSTISGAIEIKTSPFTASFDGGSFSNLSQPSGPDIDAMQSTIMNQAQFRKFATHNSVVFNFVVNTDTSNELAGIRWYELRQDADGQPWSIYQEGTYIAPNGRHAFGASMAMDGDGNIGMGYSSVSTTESISLRYSGRFVNDPLNTMTALEELIVQSTGDCPTDRYADYSHLTVDPSNDSDFWFVSEYFNGAIRSDMVGVFQLSEPLDSDIGVLSINSPSNGLLTNAEAITLTIANYGLESQTNFPVSYSINNENLVTEMFTDVIAQGETAIFTFNTTADFSILDQTYTITGTTNLNGDDNTNNNSNTIDVVNALDFCIPGPTFDCTVDGIKRFVLGTIDAGSGENGCSSTGIITGYVDRKNLSTDLEKSNTETHSLQAQHNWTDAPDSESLSMWIDFDDSGTFDTDEHLIQGESFTVAGTLETFNFTIPSTAQTGTHILRAKAIDITANGDINEPCSNFDFGEVHDYTVNITDSTLNTDDLILNESDFKVFTLNNNKYEFELTSELNGNLSFRVYDALGKTVVYNNISKINGMYKYSLDMSYASSGLYIVRMGTRNNYKSYKLIVK